MEIIKKIPNIQFADKGNFFLIAGPCVIEGEEIVNEIAKRIQQIA